MTGLKKKAWKSLTAYLFSSIAAGYGLFYLVRHHDEVSLLSDFPTRVIITSLAILAGIWVAVGRFVFKKRTLKGLDERERLIYENAQIISDSIFGGLCLAGFMGLFGWLGPQAPISVYVPVLMFFGFAFLAEIIRPVLILIQFRMESPND